MAFALVRRAMSAQVVSPGALIFMMLCFATGLASGCMVAVGDEVQSNQEAMEQVPAEEHARLKVMVINFDPRDESGRLLSDAYEWYSAEQLAWQHVADMYFNSGKAVAYDVVEWRNVRSFPPQVAEPFTLDSYRACLKDCYDNRDADYVAIIEEHALCREVAEHRIDEVWLFGGPGFGFNESRMAGRNAFFVNGDAIEVRDGWLATTFGCPRPFLVMGFNVGRAATQMLHNFGHRVDYMLKHYVENDTPGLDPNAVAVFTTPKAEAGFAGCGTTHHPPNLLPKDGEYFYGLNSSVQTECDSVGPVPDPDARRRRIDCGEWDCTENGYHKWRLNKLPRTAHTNWWRHFFPNAEWSSGKAAFPLQLPPAM